MSNRIDNPNYKKYLKELLEYKNNHKGRDPIMNHLSANLLSTWVNIVAGGLKLYWDISICPMCGEIDSVRHAYQECKHVAQTNLFEISLNSKENVHKRVQAVKDLY